MTTSVYIHIPFCKHLCTYCDFCKVYYQEDIASKYLDGLKREINDNYHDEELETIYIGGGTPSSLSMNNLNKLMEIISVFKKKDNYEFTFECNPENINWEKLLLLKENGVNRISMGVESTKEEFLSYLGRKHDYDLVKEKIDLIRKSGIQNINVDLIYGIPGETINDLKNDLDNIIKLDTNHISTYSLEIHDNTILGINNTKTIDEEKDREMYDYICNYLQEKGFNHYEISNFCKDNYYSRHNLVYWENKEYYGFGLGASGYINNMRYTNTSSMQKYLSGNRVYYEEIMNKDDIISYALILGFRLVNGINKEAFKKRYHQDLVDIKNIKDLIEHGYLVDDGENIKISYDKIYIENSILENFV